MKLAVRPPEYFPRLSYAAVLLAVDRFVIADTFPYSRQSTQNRCRIRTGQPAAPRRWLTIPLVSGAPGTPIREVEIAADDRWRRAHRKSILHHYSSSPFFVHFVAEIDDLIERPGRSLSAITEATVRMVARAIGSSAEIVTASEMRGEPATLAAVLAVAGSDELVTLDESVEPDLAAASGAGVSARGLAFTEFPRRQNFPGFIPDCSSLDLILNHGPASATYLYECMQLP